MHLTTICTTAAVLLLAAPVAAQNGAETTVYEGAGVPVWVMVEDDEGEGGAHRVYVAVTWDDHRSGLPFARSLAAGTLGVLLPKTEDADEADLSDACHFTNSRMDHGNGGLHPTEREDAECLAPPAKRLPLIWVDYEGSPAPIACTDATRTDGTEDPEVRYFACYYSGPPDEGG